MDLKKLKLAPFKNIKVANFPENFNPGVSSTNENVEVVMYYIDPIADVEKFVALCHSLDLLKENRTILVYRKGRKDGVNRDTIFLPFQKQVY